MSPLRERELRQSLLSERENFRESLHRSGFNPDYLFGEGMRFSDLRELQGIGFFQGANRQKGVGVPSAKDGTNWFDALCAAIRNRGENDHSLDRILAAFGIQDINTADGGLMGASLKFRRGGVGRICDLLNPLRVNISFLPTKGNASGEERSANLAAAAFAPEYLWLSFMYGRQEFVVARPDATRSPKYIHIVGPDNRERAERMGLVDARIAENLCVNEGLPLFVVSILPSND